MLASGEHPYYLRNLFMQVYADPEFVRGLSRLHSEERESVENCLYKLKNRNWDVGLRVKRLKGFPKRVWEARVNRADRLLFLIAPATHGSTGATGSLYVLDYVGHDHVTRVRRRDLSASSYLSLVLEQVQQPGNVEEEFDSCTSEQVDNWTHEEAQSGAATEHLRAYAQRFVATAEEIESFSDTDRELWLTEEQMAVVTAAGHGIVSGTAGSGKTTMAVQRLLADAGSSQPKLYLAYNPWLVEYARDLFQRLLPEEERETLKGVVHFRTVQQITREFLGPALENFPEEGEVRFADFQLPYQAWNKQIPSATAWSEIRSIIKGACLDPKRDLLDLKKYRELGKSRSAYLHQDREVIHKLAQQYQKWLKEKKRYDEIDLSRQAVRQILSQRPAGYGTIVCDEVQDLTELQLEFIFLLNSKEGSLFFTGDLNQIINPSGFRWEEVNSHFYRRKQQPERQHLSYNFRSVGSIVKLADAILRLRGRLIGGGLEQQRDHHLQEGRKPRLISSSDEASVKSLVAGLVGQYAILVRTESQRNRLKTETGSPFVFTIEEAKGLEFDRTLIWDFFRDQQPLWRKALGGTLSAKDGPALRHELNLLYVAATRPRRWLYFYDPHTTIWAEAELDGAFDYAIPDSLAEGSEARLTPEQWSQQGKYYLDREFFEQASFCFEQAGDPNSARRVHAKMLEHKRKWGEAGEEYFALQDFSAAASLLEKGGAWRRASEAYQQAGDSQEALRCDAQAAEAEKQWAVASRIWISLGQTGRALNAIKNDLASEQVSPNPSLIAGSFQLFQEATRNNSKAVSSLLTQGADVDGQTESGKTALMAVACSGNTEIMELLFAAGADTGIRDSDGWTPLMYAATSGNIKAVELLLYAGADINEGNGNSSGDWTNGTTALMGAAYWGHVAMVKFLLDRVPSKELRDNNGKNALQYAREQGHHQVVKLLQSYVSREFEAVAGISAIIADNPDDGDAYSERGDAYFEAGNVYQAIADYTESIRLAPGSERTYLARGMANSSCGNLTQAISDFSEAVKINDRSAGAYLLRGLAYNTLGNFSQAIADYTEAIRTNPSHALAYYNRGVAHNASGDQSSAYVDYLDATVLAPSFFEAHVNLGCMHRDAGYMDEASEEFEEATRIDPNHNDYKTASCFPCIWIRSGLL